MTKHHQLLLICSWVDLPLICESSSWIAFHFRDCQNCFCPLLTLTTSIFYNSGYISPEVMATLLSALSGLKTPFLDFRSPQSRPDWESRRPPPSKRSVIPALKYFSFKGVIEYLEDLVAFIDAPQLDEMARDSPNSSVVHQYYSGIAMNMWNSMMASPASNTLPL